MKTTKIEIFQIIREEFEKQKNILNLENKKNLILKQLKEMDYNIDERFFGLIGKEEKEKRDKLEKQFDSLISSGAIGDKKSFLNKAANDNYDGKAITQIGYGGDLDGSKMIMYKKKNDKTKNL